MKVVFISISESFNMTRSYFKNSSRCLGTALHYAVDANALRCVRSLLERGIDIHLRDTGGRTARESGLARKL